jgi:hypothetical protein
MKLTWTIYGLSPTHLAGPLRLSKGFTTNFNLRLEPTHLAKSLRFSKGFFTVCNYGLTTTQQQAHNRASAGFKIVSKAYIRFETKLTLGLTQSLCKFS